MEHNGFTKGMRMSPIIVIFGVTGDLSRRKLLPALYHLISHDLLDEKTRIVGVSRQAITLDKLLDDVELCVLETDKVCDPIGLRKLHDALQLVQLDPTEPKDYDKLAELLDSFDKTRARDRLMYMAIPPSAYTPIIGQLGIHGLNDDRTRLLVEKPFGHDTESANKLVHVTNEYFEESQVYRIDHYLAKETAQNLLTFRQHNPIFASLWNSEHIEKIHLRAYETIGIEGRADFYEKTGALRDIIQSHLMQLLAIIMMDRPESSISEDIHAGKLAFLKSLTPADPEKAERAQYKGYKFEVNNSNSQTETYARLELQSQLDRWRDTEIILETGKALNEKTTEVIVQFKYPHERRRNQLRFRLQPNEGISLDLFVKSPGFDSQMHGTELDFSYKNTFEKEPGHPDAYERVIMDVVRGDQSLFASSDELLTAWEIIQQVLNAWGGNSKPLKQYPKGSEDPI